MQSSICAKRIESCASNSERVACGSRMTSAAV
jgi:hypothetical protein